MTKLHVALVLLLVPVRTWAEDWPVFRGSPTQSGRVQITFPVAAPFDRMSARWKYATGNAIEATPIVADGVVYIGSFDKHLHAVELATGKLKWKTELGAIKAPAGIKDGTVYVGNIDGKFFALNAADGKVLWSHETDGEITAGCNFYKDLILIGSHDSTLYAFDKQGKIRWQVKTEGPVNGSPAVVGDRTFVAGCDSILHIIDIPSGKEVATVDLEGQAGATAAILGDQLYVGTMTNQVLAIDWKQAKVLWRFEAPKRKQPFYSSAALTDDLVIVGSRDKRLWAIERKTGKERWSFLTEGRVDASPLVVNDRVFFGTLADDNIFYVLDTSKGTEVQRLTLDGAVIGSPIAVGANILVGTEKGTLWCLGPG